MRLPHRRHRLDPLQVLGAAGSDQALRRGSGGSDGESTRAISSLLDELHERDLNDGAGAR